MWICNLNASCEYASFDSAATSTVWWGLCIIGPYFFLNVEGGPVTVYGSRYRVILVHSSWPEPTTSINSTCDLERIALPYDYCIWDYATCANRPTSSRRYSRNNTVHLGPSHPKFDRPLEGLAPKPCWPFEGCAIP